MKFRPGLLSEYSEDDPRFALSYAGGGVSGATPQGADALGRVAYGFTGAGGVQDAAGLLGGPSLPENVKGGNYLDAALQGAGVLPVVGGVAKGLLGAGALYKAAKMGAPEIKAALDPSVVRMFLGPNAKTADKAALAEAEALHSSGASREDIWNKTGWFKGVDDKWRFEVPDNEATFNRMPNEVQLRKRDNISQSFSHPDLYSSYDNVADMKLKPGYGMPASTRGDYSSETDTIRLNALNTLRDKPQARSTTLHELQHKIQANENFARGGSASDPSLSNIVDESKVSDFRKAYKENPDFARHVDLFNSNEHNQAIQQSNRYYRENFQPKLEELAKQMVDLPRGSAERDAIRDARFALQRQADSELMAKFPIIKQVEQANAYWQNKIGQSLFEPQNSVLEPYEAYRRLAGEVEARTTQKRMDMTADERKARYPWLDYDVPENQQIVRFRGLLGQ